MKFAAAVWSAIQSDESTHVDLTLQFLELLRSSAVSFRRFRPRDGEFRRQRGDG